jgi:hypothetical protein
MKVLLNTCYGGFGFSEEFLTHLESVHPDMFTSHGLDSSYWNERDDERIVNEAIAFGCDPEDAGRLLASGPHARLSVVEVPDGCEYYIREYDGTEYISHTTFTICEDMLKAGLTDEQIQTARKVDYLKVVSWSDYWDGDASAQFALAD